MQHCRGRLDDVLGGLSGAAEAVVSGHGKVLVAAAAVLQLKHLAGDDCVLLGHTAHKDDGAHVKLAGRRVEVSSGVVVSRSRLVELTSYQTLSLLPNTLMLLRCVMALSTAYSSPISTSAVPGTLFMNFTFNHINAQFKLNCVIFGAFREETTTF